MSAAGRLPRALVALAVCCAGSGLAAPPARRVPVPGDECALVLAWRRPEQSGVLPERALAALEALATRATAEGGWSPLPWRIEADAVVVVRTAASCPRAALDAALAGLAGGPGPRRLDVDRAVTRLHEQAARRRRDAASRALDAVRLAARDSLIEVAAPPDAEALARLDPVGVAEAAALWRSGVPGAEIHLYAPPASLPPPQGPPRRPQPVDAAQVGPAPAAGSAGPVLVEAGRPGPGAGPLRGGAVALAWPVDGTEDAFHTSLLVEMALRGQGSFVQRVAVASAQRVDVAGKALFVPADPGGGLLVFVVSSDGELSAGSVALALDAISDLARTEPSRDVVLAALRRLRADRAGENGIPRALDAERTPAAEPRRLRGRREIARVARQVAALAGRVLSADRRLAAVAGRLAPGARDRLGDGGPVAALRWTAGGPEWVGPPAAVDAPLSDPAAVATARSLLRRVVRVPGASIAGGFRARYRILADTPLGPGRLEADVVRDASAAEVLFAAAATAGGEETGPSASVPAGLLSFEPAWLLASALDGGWSILAGAPGDDGAGNSIRLVAGDRPVEVRIVPGRPEDRSPIRRLELLVAMRGTSVPVQALEPLAWELRGPALVVSRARLTDALGFERVVELEDWAPIGLSAPSDP